MKFIRKINVHAKGLGIMASCLLVSAMLSAQDKTYPIKTSAKPNDLKTYEVNEANGNISILFTKKGKKNEIYSNYVFDKDLNLVSETEEEMDVEQAKKKLVTSGSVTGYILGIGSMGGIIKDNVLTVENSIVGAMTIKKGYIGWGAIRNPMNGQMIYQEGFFARETVKPKGDNGRRLIAIAFQTDAPGEYFSDSKSFGGRSFTTSKTAATGRAKLLSDATGDVVVVSTLNTIGTKDPTTGEKIFGSNFKFLAQRYSAENLELKAETAFEFPFSYEFLFKQEATDGSNDILLIMAPGMGATKKYSNPNKNEYVYLRIDIDTKIKERVMFNSPYGRLNNLCAYNFGEETIIMGTSKAGNESKFASFVPFKSDDNQLVIIKIRSGQEPIVKATPINSLAAPIINFAANDALQTTDNQIWITGQVYEKKGNDPEKWGNAYAFDIAPDGSISKHLVLSQTEKTSEKAASPISLTKLNDGSLFWNTYEYTKKGNMYPKYAKITNGNLGSVVFPGDKKYIVNETFPFYVSSDKKYLLYFGNTEDNKQLWLYKEAL